MAREHNFKRMKNRKHPDPRYAMFECKRCDSIVAYDRRLTESEVNQMVSKSKFACLPIPN